MLLRNLYFRKIREFTPKTVALITVGPVRTILVTFLNLHLNCSFFLYFQFRKTTTTEKENTKRWNHHRRREAVM